MTKVNWVAEPLNRPKPVTKKDLAILAPKKEPKPSKAMPKPKMENGMSHVSKAKLESYGKKKK